jgi:hypothetical protein
MHCFHAFDAAPVTAYVIDEDTIAGIQPSNLGGLEGRRHPDG